MMLEEMQARLKKEKVTTQDELWAVISLYILLDLDKDDFCKIVDTVGLEKLIRKQNYYERLLKAETELSAKEKYLEAKCRLNELYCEMELLNSIVDCYEQKGA